ncbi:MAG TPA: NRDE family protein [Candidatus Binataceae bacterium]|nr:NRDE family protein [Candidatus Binataceae bacterium]
MCTLAIYFQMTDDYPVVIAANRDEYLDRPAAKPITLCERPHIVGGKDLRAGGTWLGVNEYGVVAGLLNRRTEAPPNLDARSRGLLCLDALRYRSAREAAEFAAHQRAQDYNPFNLLIASREAAFVAYNRIERIEVVRLQPGFHLLTNLNVDDFECPRISASYAKFAELGKDVGFRRDPLIRRAQLQHLLADHNTQLDPRSGRPNSICMHLDAYGTRSSSQIFIGREAGDIEHYFAAGPPCKSAYEPAEVPDQSENSSALK